MNLLSSRIECGSVYQHLIGLLAPQVGATHVQSLSALPQDIREGMSFHYLAIKQHSFGDRVVTLDLLECADLQEAVKRLAWEIFRNLSYAEKTQIGLQEEQNQADVLFLLQRMSECLGDWTPGLQAKIDMWAQNRPPLAQVLVDFLKERNKTAISLQNFQLTHLSCVFSDIPLSQHLEELDLRNNQFEKIPEEIFSLSALRKLNLSLNRLDCVPEQIGLLSNLTILTLSYNRISALADAMGSLSHLQCLYLSDNRLSQLPLSMCQLNHLEVLWANGNQLSMCAEDIGLLPQLSVLDLSDNAHLENIPNSILDRGLRHLGLVGTAFADRQAEYLTTLQGSSPKYAGISFAPSDEDISEEQDWDGQETDRFISVQLR